MSRRAVYDEPLDDFAYAVRCLHAYYDLTRRHAAD